MTENRVVALRQKGAIDDPLTEILRTGARRLIAQAVEAEFETFLASTAELVLPDGRRRVVRHGHDPVRAIQTGIGPIEVQRPKARDRAAASGERVRFTSNILPKWARRTKSLDALLPVLYLRGISAGDFQEALAALLGKDAPNLSAAVIARLKSEWEDEYRRWQKRDLSARHYVYVWADGVYLQARMEPQAECMLVLMGATPEGKKELIGFQTGMRESGQSWKELLVDLKARGLVVAPQAAIGDGALGFWKALDEAFPTTRHQRCWLHKTLNVLDKLPKSMQPSAHKDLREIWLSPSRGAAEAAMTTFSRSIRLPVALIRMAVSLILPVRLPVIPLGKAYGNTLNYLVFVDRKGEKIGLKSPISMFFSLLPGVRPPRRPVSQDCAHHQEVRANWGDFLVRRLARHSRDLRRRQSV